MQAWWAEETLKTLKILLFKNFWLVVYIPNVLFCKVIQVFYKFYIIILLSYFTIINYYTILLHYLDFHTEYCKKLNIIYIYVIK